ncbi:MAG TPA: UDP-N-acetylglucosamine--N-acetylmuramyl-(pentapeptide) pyrophosphoryl-undecaprenol N-acetylglucosamine transferase [Anaerolineaceae bacterium]|jgi:UDP-N-acetylglucosamine--N-acetylmuramyl-(pentapeptide) pyrophosphoryl-undecaprenol N-acetylglucosamine transferase|nr:UDP-N-acetylglucosamine--N-acetylmuramyl-(pentapeptide) pyrophosphoryl-undecaprenol N-acetylglucosamine transferase [Anaerolineaceae bacterium]HOT26009.1 UDP-N-acetylglucosamine--N-acetylmuramyl-(pentapeptide) pyrophosphoryl-undecaprenol N-acetylglucosamine transferase [Anaerolineaceae bacterium]HQH58500.1 UDP-N-acetylglucosamine--N-acetylmuramyl-(pentapeptide) pyrophosphoryl-undecaprenol N-acetylglucosamine transferase [Anaerolineaceae bacterium]HQK02676.1 UDP-N-acetylglucosamine--N-acetylmu
METLRNDAHELLWVGSDGGMEKALVERAGLPFTAVPAAGVHGVSLKKLPGNLVRLWKGYRKSRQLLRQFNPDVLFFTGGYVAIPMAVAGLRRRSVLFVPDIEPGLALKVLARFASRIAVSVEESRRFFKQQEKITVTGYPLREDLKKWSKDEARAYFGFDPKVKTILFLGGSSGARSINQAVMEIAEKLIADYQVIHLTGHLDWDVVQNQTKQLGPRYQAFPYLHEVGAALACADLVVSRAGASTLGEYPFFGLPAVLVPYPYAWKYQKVNADYLVDRGAAILLEDQSLKTRLLPTITALMEDPRRLAAMSAAMSALANPDAALAISELLLEMAGT